MNLCRAYMYSALHVQPPQEVELSYIRFHPYWDSSLVVLEKKSRKVLPHQAFVREYLIDIDKSHLESKFPDSLRFTAEIVYSKEMESFVFPGIFYQARPVYTRGMG